MGPTHRACCSFSLLALLASSVGPIASCGGSGEGEDPVATVRYFLELMERSGSDESALADAYALLDDGAQKQLAARADRARSLSGRAFSPWQMLVQGRFRLRFAPVSPGGLRARVQGDRALVTALGAKGERAEIPLVKQDGRWRIELALPPLRAESAAARQDAP